MGNKYDLWDKMITEFKLHRFAGPFEKIPCEDSHAQSPVGLVDKSNGQTHLIFHLSYDFQQHKSINHHTPAGLCSVKYNDFDKTVHLCQQIGHGAFMGKPDMKSSFWHLLLRPQDRRWLVMKAKNPWENDKTYFFVDKCTPFGSSISCSNFQRVSNVVEFIFRKRTERRAINYLDDFFFVALREAVCNNLLQAFIDLCQEISFPLALEKTE